MSRAGHLGGRLRSLFTWRPRRWRRLETARGAVGGSRWRPGRPRRRRFGMGAPARAITRYHPGRSQSVSNSAGEIAGRGYCQVGPFLPTATHRGIPRRRCSAPWQRSGTCVVTGWHICPIYLDKCAIRSQRWRRWRRWRVRGGGWRGRRLGGGRSGRCWGCRAIRGPRSSRR